MFRVKRWTGGNERAVIQQIAYLLTILTNEKMITALFWELKEFLEAFTKKVAAFKIMIDQKMDFAESQEIQKLLFALIDPKFITEYHLEEPHNAEHIVRIRQRHQWDKVQIHQDDFHRLFSNLSSHRFIGFITFEPKTKIGLMFYESEDCDTIERICNKINSDVTLAISLCIDKIVDHTILRVTFCEINKSSS